MCQRKTAVLPGTVENDRFVLKEYYCLVQSVSCLHFLGLPHLTMALPL